jgi:CRISPR-associated exonuclease Cas4
MESIPLSALQHWLYCPRQCALIHNEQVWAENQFTAEGQLLHKKANEEPDEHGGIFISVKSLECQRAG